MYDSVETKNNTQYGVIYGEGAVVYIKPGNGGDIYGYENKYLQIAEKIKNIYGYSVVAARNPVKIQSGVGIENDMSYIREKFGSDIKIFAFGFSKGAQILASYSHNHRQISRVLAVNAPLMVNYHRIKGGIEAFGGEKITLLYGERDQSIPYIKALENIKNSAFSFKVIKDADHCFKGMLEEFMELPFEYLLK